MNRNHIRFWRPAGSRPSGQWRRAVGADVAGGGGGQPRASRGNVVDGPLTPFLRGQRPIDHVRLAETARYVRDDCLNFPTDAWHQRTLGCATYYCDVFNTDEGAALSSLA